MSDELMLNETELLLLQQQMKGNISGVGYSLEDAGVEKADYRGREGQNIYDSAAVQAADQTGWIRIIKFHIDDPSDPDNDRTLLLHIYRDGHIRCERYVKPIIADKVIAELELIHEYSDFLTPLNELLSDHIQDNRRGHPSTKTRDYIKKINGQFDDLIESYFDTGNISGNQKRLYVSIVANIGLVLCKENIPNSSDLDDIIDTGENSLDIDNDDKIMDFFSEYTRENHGVDVDHSEITNHLEYVLSQPSGSIGSGDETPLDMIEHVIEYYNLSA